MSVQWWERVLSLLLLPKRHMCGERGFAIEQCERGGRVAGCVFGESLCSEALSVLAR
jgi:hypothetical protein